MQQREKAGALATPTASRDHSHDDLTNSPRRDLAQDEIDHHRDHQDHGAIAAGPTDDDMEIPEFLRVENRQPVTPAPRPEAHMTTKPKSWRDVLPVHPAADLFPLMSPEELKVLGEDIKKHGLKTPITVCGGHGGASLQLLDGRNRLDAMEAVGLEIRRLKNEIEYYNDDTMLVSESVSQCVDPGTDPYEYVISANIHRRHLTAEQKREIIAKVLKAQPEKSNRAIAKQVKADDKTVGAVRAKLESTAEIPQLEKTTGADGKPRPAKKPKERRGPQTPQEWEEWHQQEDDRWLQEAAKVARAAAAVVDRFGIDGARFLLVVTQDVLINRVFDRLEEIAGADVPAEVKPEPSPSTGPNVADDPLEIPPMLRRTDNGGAFTRWKKRKDAEARKAQRDHDEGGGAS
jgi:hypothetical protein